MNWKHRPRCEMMAQLFVIGIGLSAANGQACAPDRFLECDTQAVADCQSNPWYTNDCPSRCCGRARPELAVLVNQSCEPNRVLACDFQPVQWCSNPSYARDCATRCCGLDIGGGSIGPSVAPTLSAPSSAPTMDCGQFSCVRDCADSSECGWASDTAECAWGEITTTDEYASGAGCTAQPTTLPTAAPATTTTTTITTATAGCGTAVDAPFCAGFDEELCRGECADATVVEAMCPRLCRGCLRTTAEPHPCDGNPCGVNSICTGEVGGPPYCNCVAGFIPDADGRCVDENECDLGRHTCPDASMCVNLIGSFACECAVGQEWSIIIGRCVACTNKPDDDNHYYTSFGSIVDGVYTGDHCQFALCDNAVCATRPEGGFLVRSGVCGGENGAANALRCVEGSCHGQCGQDVYRETEGGGRCHCDNGCAERGTCCPDISTTCTVAPSPAPTRAPTFELRCPGFCETRATFELPQSTLELPMRCICSADCLAWTTSTNAPQCCPDYFRSCQAPRTHCHGEPDADLCAGLTSFHCRNETFQPDIFSLCPILCHSCNETNAPSTSPTTPYPTKVPTAAPSFSPSPWPTRSPISSYPTVSPTVFPSTSTPTMSPSTTPTASPTKVPTTAPTSSLPTVGPTTTPTAVPTGPPSTSPSIPHCNGATVDTAALCAEYSTADCDVYNGGALMALCPILCQNCPTDSPTTSQSPSTSPSASPSVSPSTFPSMQPSTSPSVSPSLSPSTGPTTSTPSASPTVSPTASPTVSPSRTCNFTRSCIDSDMCSHLFEHGYLCRHAVLGTGVLVSELCPFTCMECWVSTLAPTGTPTALPSMPPSAAPSPAPTGAPSPRPSAAPASTDPTAAPRTSEPTSAPTSVPTTPQPTSFQRPPSLPPSPGPTRAPIFASGSCVCNSDDPQSMCTPSPRNQSLLTLCGTYIGRIASPHHRCYCDSMCENWECCPDYYSVCATHSPTAAPATSDPTPEPTTSAPTPAPSSVPTTDGPTPMPSSAPSASDPTRSPSTHPTSYPTHAPTVSPATSVPTALPSSMPSSASPTASPTVSEPSAAPMSSVPTVAPTVIPTAAPTLTPTITPTAIPTNAPSWTRPPTVAPTYVLEGSCRGRCDGLQDSRTNCSCDFDQCIGAGGTGCCNDYVLACSQVLCYCDGHCNMFGDCCTVGCVFATTTTTMSSTTSSATATTTTATTTTASTVTTGTTTTFDVFSCYGMCNTHQPFITRGQPRRWNGALPTTCFCDQECFLHDDCCEDQAQACSTTTTTTSTTTTTLTTTATSTATTTPSTTVVTTATTTAASTATTTPSTTAATTATTTAVSTVTTTPVTTVTTTATTTATTELEANEHFFSLYGPCDRACLPAVLAVLQGEPANFLYPEDVLRVTFVCISATEMEFSMITRNSLIARQLAEWLETGPVFAMPSGTECGTAVPANMRTSTTVTSATRTTTTTTSTITTVITGVPTHPPTTMAPVMPFPTWASIIDLDARSLTPTPAPQSDSTPAPLPAPTMAEPTPSPSPRPTRAPASTGPTASPTAFNGTTLPAVATTTTATVMLSAEFNVEGNAGGKDYEKPILYVVVALTVIGFLGVMVFHYQNKTKQDQKKKQASNAIRNIEDIRKDQARNIAFSPAHSVLRDSRV